MHCVVLWVICGVSLFGQTRLIEPGAVWKYMDNGSDQGTAWRGKSFNDAAWPSGRAKLGYGEGDEGTVVRFGPNANAKYPTTYFRRAITVEHPERILGLTLKVLRDDGVIVYVNGAEVYRNNMPRRAVRFTTAASGAAADDGKEWWEVRLTPLVLSAGTNVVAAEVHQANGGSSDLSFDLELTAMTSALLTRGPYLQKGTPGGSVVVRWRTNAATDSRVQYGLSAGKLTSGASDGAVKTEHEVTLTGLAPNTKYYYSVGTSLEEIAGGDTNHYFVTPPAAGGQRAARIWVLGDAGSKNEKQARVRDAYYAFTGTRHTDLWLMLGDNAYEKGTDKEYQEAVFDVYPSMLRKSVLWPTIGNHDTAESANPPSSLPYFQMFTLPVHGEAGGLASGTERYYSFDFGNIHFVCLDSMTSQRTPGGAMLSWLQNDLAANTKEWLIVFFHHPPYSKGSHNSDKDKELVEMRQNVAPVLENYGVDLVLSGHSHSYERSFLIDGHYGMSKTFQKSMKVDGGSGRPEETGAYRKLRHGPAARQGAVYTVAGSSGKTSGGKLNHPAMFVSMNTLGSMVLDVNGGRLEAKFLTDKGAVADSFTMIKGASVRSTETKSGRGLE